MNRIITHQPTIPSRKLDSYEKGRLFEEYVISLFNKDSFWLLDWQMSKKRDEYTHLDLNYPDLYLLFAGRKHYRFAVECKFVSVVNHDEQFEWASDGEIKSYRRYQAKFNIPVFIVIGIGGEPSSPEKLFVTPLYEICNNTSVVESDLMPYKRKPTQRFFYDTIQLKLF
jgi:hypothetical protein